MRKLAKLGLFLAFLCTAAAPAVAAPFRLIITETETPLVPNSVQELAKTLGYYARAGVDVEIVRVQQTPSAVAALRAGGGDMANIGFDTALQLVARKQMDLRGVVSPDPALPFLIATKASIAAPKDLDGKVFGIARIGSVDDTLSRIVLAKLGVDVPSLQFLAVGQPQTRALALAAGRLDATSFSVGIWTSMPDRSRLKVLVEQPDFFKLAPFVSKLSVVTAATDAAKAKEIGGVVRAIVAASRDFAADPGRWVDAMAKARPDVDRRVLESLGEAYRKSWAVTGGLDPAELTFTTDELYKTADFSGLPRIAPTQWIDRRFVEAAAGK